MSSNDLTLNIQSGLNISESVIMTNSNNDADLVGTNFFSVILIRYSGKFVFRLRHNKTGNQRCYFLYNQYPLHWHLVKHASLLRKVHHLIALLYSISALDCKVWLSVGHYEKVRQRCSVSVYSRQRPFLLSNDLCKWLFAICEIVY